MSAGKPQYADPVLANDLTAVDGNVLDAGLVIAGDQQSGRDIASAVALIVLGREAGGADRCPRE